MWQHKLFFRDYQKAKVNTGGFSIKIESPNWILCPVCGNKTRLKIRGDTELKNFPLYCPKCRQETLINVTQTLQEKINRMLVTEASRMAVY